MSAGVSSYNTGPRSVWRSPSVVAAGSALLLCGCAGASGPAPNAPVVEGPEDAILRIASFWEAHSNEKGLRSSPSPIASFERQLVSRLELARGQTTATETLSATERFTLRDAAEVHCSARFDISVSISYGNKAGEPALEIQWPDVSRARDCDTPGAAIPPFERPAGKARFVLRSDQLVGVEPALEKRTFLPVE